MHEQNDGLCPLAQLAQSVQRLARHLIHGVVQRRHDQILVLHVVERRVAAGNLRKLRQIGLPRVGGVVVVEKAPVVVPGDVHGRHRAVPNAGFEQGQVRVRREINDVPGQEQHIRLNALPVGEQVRHTRRAGHLGAGKALLARLTVLQAVGRLHALTGAGVQIGEMQERIGALQPCHLQSRALGVNIPVVGHFHHLQRCIGKFDIQNIHPVPRPHAVVDKGHGHEADGSVLRRLVVAEDARRFALFVARHAQDVRGGGGSHRGQPELLQIPDIIQHNAQFLCHLGQGDAGDIAVCFVRDRLALGILHIQEALAVRQGRKGQLPVGGQPERLRHGFCLGLRPRIGCGFRIACGIRRRVGRRLGGRPRRGNGAGPGFGRFSGTAAQHRQEQEGNQKQARRAHGGSLTVRSHGESPSSWLFALCSLLFSRSAHAQCAYALCVWYHTSSG